MRERWERAARHQRGGPGNFSWPGCPCVLCAIREVGERVSFVSWDPWPDQADARRESGAS